MLGEDALENLEFAIAKKAFHRLRDSRMLILIHELEVFIFFSLIFILFYEIFEGNESTWNINR